MIYAITLTEEQFDALNARRGDLIRQKFAGAVTEDEAKEFEALQEIAGQVRDANTPPLAPELQKTMDDLGIK